MGLSLLLRDNVKSNCTKGYIFEAVEESPCKFSTFEDLEF